MAAGPPPPAASPRESRARLSGHVRPVQVTGPGDRTRIDLLVEGGIGHLQQLQTLLPRQVIHRAAGSTAAATSSACVSPGHPFARYRTGTIRSGSRTAGARDKGMQVLVGETMLHPPRQWRHRPGPPDRWAGERHDDEQNGVVVAPLEAEQFLALFGMAVEGAVGEPRPAGVRRRQQPPDTARPHAAPRSAAAASPAHPPPSAGWSPQPRGRHDGADPTASTARQRCRTPPFRCRGHGPAADAHTRGGQRTCGVPPPPDTTTGVSARVGASRDQRPCTTSPPSRGTHPPPHSPVVFSTVQAHRSRDLEVDLAAHQRAAGP